MNKSAEIQKNVEAAMNSLDGVQQADPGAFFFTRVAARLNREKKRWDRIGAFIARPAVAISVICLVVVMNTWAVLQQREQTPVVVGHPEQSIYDDEANLAARRFYDYENIEP